MLITLIRPYLLISTGCAHSVYCRMMDAWYLRIWEEMPQVIGSYIFCRDKETREVKIISLQDFLSCITEYFGFSRHC